MSKERIYSTKSEIESMGIQRKLDSENIPYLVVDKTDSSYASIIGDIEFLVDKEYVQKAKEAIEDYFKD